MILCCGRDQRLHDFSSQLPKQFNVLTENLQSNDTEIIIGNNRNFESSFKVVLTFRIVLNEFRKAPNNVRRQFRCATQAPIKLNKNIKTSTTVWSLGWLL